MPLTVLRMAEREWFLAKVLVEKILQ